DDDRFAMVKDSSSVTIMARLHVDLFMQDKLLLPYIPMQINFVLNPESVMFLSGPAVENSRAVVADPVLEIQDFKLLIRKFSIDSEVHNGIDKG
ncbi:hypothetical protein NQU39_25450, partial [Escherichia coli]|uniref:hypothetical protein n=1 Tax=Escherichia coli TaxID=562 RepID=UPI0021196BE8